MKRLFLIALLLLAAAVPAAAQETALRWSATIETGNGALLVSGQKNTITAIQESLQQKCPDCTTIEKTAEFIKNNYPAGIEIQMFRESDLPLGADVSRLKMSLRRAIMLGLVPPVEGLARDDARELLSAVGIAMYSPVEWAAMDLTARVALASSALREIVVADSFSPQDNIELIFAGNNGVKK